MHCHVTASTPEPDIVRGATAERTGTVPKLGGKLESDSYFSCHSSTSFFVNL